MKKLLFSSSLVLLSISSLSFANNLSYPANPTFIHSKNENVLVGQDGLALYTFKKDVNSPIPPKCTNMKDNGPLGSCLARWPAATVTFNEIEKLSYNDKNFGAVYNNNIKKLQLTYLGFPVYYWFKDSSKHNFTGDGVGNSWSLILKDKSPIMFSGLNK